MPPPTVALTCEVDGSIQRDASATPLAAVTLTREVKERAEDGVNSVAEVDGVRVQRDGAAEMVRLSEISQER
jgi:hypothetical protein